MGHILEHTPSHGEDEAACRIFLQHVTRSLEHVGSVTGIRMKADKGEGVGVGVIGRECSDLI